MRFSDKSFLLKEDGKILLENNYGFYSGLRLYNKPGEKDVNESVKFSTFVEAYVYQLY